MAEVGRAAGAGAGDVARAAVQPLASIATSARAAPTLSMPLSSSNAAAIACYADPIVNDAEIVPSPLRRRLENDRGPGHSASNSSTYGVAIADSVCNSDHTWSGGAGRRGPRGQAGTARGVLPDERGDEGRARRRPRPRRGPPSDVLSHHARHRAHRNREESPMRRMRPALSLVTAALALLVLHAGPAHAQKKTLVVALNQDPDLLDPTLARTYVGRIVFSHICEKLYEIDEGLRISPQLAAALPVIADGGRTVSIKLRSGVKFNDGPPMDAEAVKFSLDRHRTLKGSNRASEL